ncbi:amidase [Bacillus sp. ISL-47]|uniref:amidase n=1 Tax=Bacillus sp. ISL-47 TaxID=2819130 RepID=UPI001BE7B3F2|nr:amidase [Bacillus sp. ISL-47]MBT2687449.1 amidase [Bacillus sp. ISL-47]MBT2710990.1 amidase [Pseudomonas sp. ISL-84]
MENLRLKMFHDEVLLEATIDELQEKMESGEVTSRELVLLYMERIGQQDSQGAAINSVLELNPEALHIAAALDAERKKAGPRSALHGIPILLKDNIDTGDKMHTSAGSLALKNHCAQKDSFVAAQLREAGAVILGKTNMTEWANFMTEGMPSGYSSRGGQTLNPYGPGKFDVGGSSAGSGAAVAANFAAAAIGTETSGSILSPASQNSLVGIKPTVGLISRTGIIPIAHSQDTAGPMARSVRDAAILLSVLAVSDENDPITLTNQDLQGKDFTEYLDHDGLKGARIGIARETYFDYLSEEKLAVMNEAVDQLKKLGAEVVEEVVIPSTKAQWSYDVLTYEFKADLNAYLRTVAPHLNIRSLADVIEFNEKNSGKTLKYGQTILTESEETSGNLTEKAYISSLEKDIYLSTEQGIDHVMQEHQLDAIVFPNNFGAGIPAKAGYPSITVPAGYTPEGEPVGMTFTGLAYSEPTLIKLAYAYEQATKKRKAPVLSGLS